MFYYFSIIYEILWNAYRAKTDGTRDNPHATLTYVYSQYLCSRFLTTLHLSIFYDDVSWWG